MKPRRKRTYRQPAIIATGMARAHAMVAGPCSVCRSVGHPARVWLPGTMLVLEVGEVRSRGVVLCDSCLGRVERACRVPLRGL